MENFVADGIFIDATRERVFEALLDPEEVLEWIDGLEARIGAGVHGEYFIVRVDGTRISGTVTEFEPGAKLSIGSWREDAEDGTSRSDMRVTFTIEPVDYGVWITVRQENLDANPDWEDYAADARRFWVHATVTLKRLIEQI